MENRSNAKRQLSDLAVFGGTPAFSEKLYVGRPNVGNRQRLLERINEMLDRKWFTNQGPFVQELERRIAEFVGVNHCIVNCNGTVALEIAIRASGMSGEVIVPSMTFISTAHALQWQGITPVFCDIDPITHNIDPARIEGLINGKTTGIIGVHLWGRPCDIEGLTEIAGRYDLKLLFDAAHAFGCSYEGRMIGGFGEAEIFSFHAAKFFNAFEGGAIVTNDDELALRARMMKNIGFLNRDHVVYVGTNGKMTEASAAMGLTSLESIDEFIAINYRNYKHYEQILENAPGVRFLIHTETEKSNYQYIVLEIDEAATGVNRDNLLKVLQAENIMAQRYFYPGCHNADPYRLSRSQASQLLPETEGLVSRVMLLPTGSAIEPEDINLIGQIIRFVIRHGGEVTTMLESGPIPDLEYRVISDARV
jgi:dTDP-4-amino-4,6-dideoxygalactose transaminase